MKMDADYDELTGRVKELKLVADTAGDEIYLRQLSLPFDPDFVGEFCRVEMTIQDENEREYHSSYLTIDSSESYFVEQPRVRKRRLLPRIRQVFVEGMASQFHPVLILIWAIVFVTCMTIIHKQPH